MNTAETLLPNQERQDSVNFATSVRRGADESQTVAGPIQGVPGREHSSQPGHHQLPLNMNTAETLLPNQERQDSVTTRANNHDAWGDDDGGGCGVAGVAPDRKSVV